MNSTFKNYIKRSQALNTLTKAKGNESFSCRLIKIRAVFFCLQIQNRLEGWSCWLHTSLPHLSSCFHKLPQALKHVASKAGASVKANVNHLTETWGMKWCAVSSGNDMIYCLTPWYAAWCLITMDVDHSWTCNSESSPLSFSETLVISGLISSHTEHDRRKLPTTTTDRTHHRPAASWTQRTQPSQTLNIKWISGTRLEVSLPHCGSSKFTKCKWIVCHH